MLKLVYHYKQGGKNLPGRFYCGGQFYLTTTLHKIISVMEHKKMLGEIDLKDLCISWSYKYEINK